MRNIFLFIRRYSNFLFFLVLQGISIYFIAHYNRYHNAAMTGTLNEVTGYLNSKYDKVNHYFHLDKVNKDLVKENEILLNRLKQNFESPDTLTKILVDSFPVDTLGTHRKWMYRGAKVVGNSVNRLNNYVQLFRGTSQGLKVDMGVVDINLGVVGKVVEVGPNFAVVMSLLHKNSVTSAKLKNGGELGSIVWDGKDPGMFTLNDIKQNAKLAKGDTVYTSNYSEYFPYGMMIGTIADFVPDKGSNNFIIHVRSAVDFNNLQYAYAIENLQKAELNGLMEKVKAKEN